MSCWKIWVGGIGESYLEGGVWTGLYVLRVQSSAWGMKQFGGDGLGCGLVNCADLKGHLFRWEWIRSVSCDCSSYVRWGRTVVS